MILADDHFPRTEREAVWVDTNYLKAPEPEVHRNGYLQPYPPYADCTSNDFMFTTSVNPAPPKGRAPFAKFFAPRRR